MNDSSSVQSGKTAITERIEDLLRGANVAYQLVEHEPVFSSEEAARVRGTRPEEGAKALVVKADEDRFFHVVLSGNRRIDNTRLRAILDTRRVRFVDDAELLALTGCVRGAVPPFGNLFGLPVLMDVSLAACEQIAFNAGSNTVSMIMRREDFERVVQPGIHDFTLREEPEPQA